MQAENLVFNNCGKRKEIKKISVVFPNIGISVLSEALVIEAIDLSNLSGLMVASKDGNPVLEPDLEGD